MAVTDSEAVASQAVTTSYPSRHDDTTLQISPPATTSPSSPPFRPVANRVATPLSLFIGGPAMARPGTEKGSAGVDVTGGGSAGKATPRDDPFVTMSPAKTPDRLVSPGPMQVVDHVSDANDSKPCAYQEHLQKGTEGGSCINRGVANSSDSGSALHYSSARPKQPRDEAPAAASAQAIAQQQMANANPTPDHHTRTLTTESSSPLSDNFDSFEARPLRTASVRADTRFVHPKPIAHPTPISNNAIDPELKVRSGSAADNIAQLEATAERMSMTSSIDDAIRELHGELKRSDSRRSANLSLAAKQSSDELPPPLPVSQLGRHLSTTSSIVSTNTAARHGGYSPAGFVMSPNPSLTSRLASGSVTSAGRPEGNSDTALSRHGPGKSSGRSVRSSKLSLAEISESEPTSLNQDAFDEADAAPPLNEQSDRSLQLPQQPVADASVHHMLEDIMGQPAVYHGHADTVVRDDNMELQRHDTQRSASIYSNNTSEQARDAFVDFDGVHYSWDSEGGLEEAGQDIPGQGQLDAFPQELHPDDQLPTPRPAPRSMARPKSYFDSETGQQMLYYPARVPAMLNLPPKLSSKPKAATRNQRRSQVLSAMMDANEMEPSQRIKQSVFTDLGGKSPGLDKGTRDSWLPDPIANHRESFAALSSFDPLDEGAEADNALSPQAPVPENEQPLEHARHESSPAVLRQPERLSKPLDKDQRMSAHTITSHLPAALRASAFFDLPSASPEVEVVDGSAMATLDSILDASAQAPVSAFTDHVYAGKLGSEVYGREKKKNMNRKSTAMLSALAVEPQPKKRSSMMWLGKRSSSYNSDDKKRPHSSMASMPSALDGVATYQDGRLTPDSVDSADHVIRVGANDEEDLGPEEEEEESNADEDYQGPPTTLLAELQLRKQEQKQRTRNLGKGFPNGMHATLLDMETVAEAQRKNRQAKRVNLAWEDPDAHIDQNGSDDEDIPLGILAAMQRGAKNVADLEQPVGLMERRDIEDNEPLSHRRARLQGLDLPSIVLPNRQSVMSFPAARFVDNQSPMQDMAPSPEPEPPMTEEIEDETLGERRRRLAEKDGELPRTRPVSVAFSAELLSQFGDLDEPKDKDSTAQKGNKEGASPPDVPPEDETLGQRRRRLQAEREARQREISYGNLVGGTSQESRRLSLANILSAHPKKEMDGRAYEEALRNQEQRRVAREQEAKMAAMRMQMPTSLPRSNVERSGGFLGGAYNDGAGGFGPKAALSTPAMNSLGLSPGNPGHGGVGRPSTYGMPQQQFGHGPPAMSSYGGMNNMGAYNGVRPMSMYNVNPAAQAYGNGMVPTHLNQNPLDRVEQWRYGVRP